MLTLWQHRLLTTIGAVALLLVLLNGGLFLTNRSSQADVAARQQFIQQTVQLETLYREIVKALAELALKNGDSQILQMLASQGISVTPNAPAPAPAAPGGKK
ncbi:MAG TPA: hypothetical protein VML58_14330 [Burkholderiaceae bacterium]|nr:hypothetical protein [Burkholderiaceae bacterium]